MPERTIAYPRASVASGERPAAALPRGRWRHGAARAGGAELQWSRSLWRSRRLRERSSCARRPMRSRRRVAASAVSSSTASGTTSAAGGGRRRRPSVRGEVAQRRVLLVADGRDDWDTRGGDGPHDRLVAEREQVLEAAAAAGENDDVDLRVLGQGRERGHDRFRRASSLHARLADDDLHGREARCDRGDEVATGSSVGPGEDPDGAWDAREPALPLRREQALGCELPLEQLERDQVSADADALDRGGAEPELAFCS